MKRDKDYIKSVIIKKDDGYYATKKTIIEFPKWYQDKGLYEISDNTFLYGIFAMIVDDKYSVSRIPTVMNTTPLMVKEIDRDGETYIQLIYGPGDRVINSQNVLMQPFLSYEYFNGFYMLAKIPWFIDYEDLIFTMDNTVKYAGNNLGSNNVGNEVLPTFISRQQKDKRMFHRSNPTGKPYFVGLMDVRYSALSTINKQAGNYPEESLVSALIIKEEKPTTLENHVRR